jgi:hypothetical protein
MKVFVLGKKWTVKVLGPVAYERRLGGGSHGISFMEDREIFVRRSPVMKETLIHELVHAYANELSLVELNLDLDDQIEEFFCELFAKYGEEILSHTKKVLARYQ